MPRSRPVCDPASAGQAVMHAAAVTQGAVSRRYSVAAQRQLNYLLHRAPRRIADGTLYHIEPAREVWNDAMFMAPPFLAAAGNGTEAARQLLGMHRLLWAPDRSLMHHVWSDDSGTLSDRRFWGVGHGWAASASARSPSLPHRIPVSRATQSRQHRRPVHRTTAVACLGGDKQAAGFTRVLQLLPPSAPEATELVAALRALIEGCVAHQRTADGLFHNIVDDNSTFVETNLAQMLAHAIFSGVADGYLDRSLCAAAVRMRRAARGKVDEWGLVQGVCGSTDFNHSGTATEGQAMFLLMEAAHARPGGCTQGGEGGLTDVASAR